MKLRSMLAAAIAIVGALFAMAPPADAARLVFGASDQLRKLQDVDVTGSMGEALYLGHKFTHHAFILPYMLTDDGYILGARNDPKRYYKLDVAKIATLQAKGLLPTPLPAYQIGMFDYVFGYLLWLLLPVIAIFGWFGARKDKKRAAAVPFFASGIGHQKEGRGEQALADFDKALSIDPKNPIMLGARGNLLAGLGRLDAAMSDFSRIIIAQPKNAAALIWRGEAFLAKGETRLALADLDRAVKASKSAEAYFARGRARLQTGDAAAAIKDFSAAIAKAPKAAVLYAARARAHDASGDVGLAAEDMTTAQCLANPEVASAPALRI